MAEAINARAEGRPHLKVTASQPLTATYSTSIIEASAASRESVRQNVLESSVGASLVNKVLPWGL